VLLAGLLYLGGGIGITLYGLARRRTREHALMMADAPVIAGITITGGIVAPVLLLWGLTRVSGLVGSLLLNLEGVFTVLLALALFGERVNRCEGSAIALVLAGAAVLTAEPRAGTVDWLGAVAIMFACLAWSLDNNLTRRLSVRDPTQIVQIKTVVAGTTNVVLALILGQRLDRVELLAPALMVGFLSYGVSILLDVYALRMLGAAREAAFFAMAPFMGAAMAIPILGDRPQRGDLVGGAIMLGGVSWLLWLGRNAATEGGALTAR
jgi:drug/metabolite transporter (DMT)-like permease